MLRKFSLACLALLVLLCFVVPYVWLADVNAWYGSFLFWTVAGVVVIGLNILATHELGGPEE